MKENIHPESITTVQATVPHGFGERLARLETEHKHMAETQTEILGILKRLTDMAQTTRQDIDKLQAEVRAARMEIAQSREISRKEAEHLQKQMLTHEHMTGFQKKSHEKLAEMQKENHKDMIAFQEAAHRRETRLLFLIVGTQATLLVAILGTFLAS